MSEAPWAKLWWDWFVSRSHIGLGGVALALGGPLMLICRASAKRHSDAPGDGSGDVTGDCVEVRDKSGKPITARALANIVRFPVSEVEAALGELVEAETLSVSADGVYAFPNFWKYQETPQAVRTRVYREKIKRHSDGHGDGYSDGYSDGVGDAKRPEARGQSNSPSLRSGEVSPKSARKPKAKPANLAALERALDAHCECAPILSRSQGQRIAARVEKLAASTGGDLDAAASALVAAWRLSGHEGNAWKLLDVVPGAKGPPARFPANPSRPQRAAATTAADFADEPSEEEQLARLKAHG